MTPFTWTVRARFSIGGHTFPEIDLTPALGVGFLIATMALTAHWS
jgi:hypothetical protein